MSNLKQAAHNSTIYLLKRRARILRFLILPSVNLRNAGFAAALTMSHSNEINRGRSYLLEFQEATFWNRT